MNAPINIPLHAESVVLNYVDDPKMTRHDVAAVYALAIMCVAATHPMWRILNRAIMDRWSAAGLRWIKKRAWAAVRDDV